MDSCFLKNNDFDYKTDHIIIDITCGEDCTFNLIAEIEATYALTPNSNLAMDFEDTAFSKTFTLDTSGI